MNNFKAAKLAFLIAAMTGGAVNAQDYKEESQSSSSDRLIQEKVDSDAYNASSDKSVVVPTPEQAEITDAQAPNSGPTPESEAVLPDRWSSSDQHEFNAEPQYSDEEQASADAKEQSSSLSQVKQQQNMDRTDSDHQAAENDTTGSDRNGSQKTVRFEFDSAELTEEAKQQLSQLANDLQQDAPLTVTITGHADQTGPEAYNQQLAEKRAESVKQYLQTTGVELSNIEVESAGESQPLNEDKGMEASQENRRVEISVEANDQELSAVTDQ